MEAAVEKMEAQLKLWDMKIDKLAAKTLKVGAQASFEELMYIDELKALRAIALSRYDEFRVAAAGDTRRAHLKAEMKSAWNELDAAFKNPKP
jgi:hypothetical protein